jgi:HAD superfamily hydrolase (TIGR01509 family)
MAYQLVIFDCDGVLVDSERLSNQVFVDMLGELGVAVTLEHLFEHFVGHSMAHCVAQITALLGAPPPADFVPSYRARVDLAFQAGLRPIPGITDVLAQLTLPACVASNGPHAKMRTTLGLAGLLPRFDGSLFSAYDVAHPKPAPDIYLAAAAVHRIAPASCVVVEDTPTGVAAGVAAGMTVLGYTALTPAHRLRAAGAHHLFDDMSALPALLAAG